MPWWRWCGLAAAGLLLAGCQIKQAVPDYGAVILQNTVPENLPDAVTWVNAVPGPFVWGEIQTAPDQPSEQWSWDTTDALIASARQQHRQVLVTLWPYALWDQASCHGDSPNLISLLGPQFSAPYAPCDTTAYQVWVRAVVARYDTSVDAWQVMSYPEQHQAPFAYFVGSSQQYYTVAQLTTDAIRFVQADTDIISGTIGQPGAQGITSQTITFWGPILERTTPAIMNVLAVAVNNEHDWQSLQSWLQRYAWTGPVWVMETPTAQPFVGASKVFYTVSND